MCDMLLVRKIVVGLWLMLVWICVSRLVSLFM